MSLLAAVLFASASYTADLVVKLADGKVSRSRVASNGVITRSDNDEDHSITYTDKSLKTMWMVTAASDCLTVPLREDGKDEVVVGHETIDGHPTTKVKVTLTLGTHRIIEYDWRATDLGDLIIRRSSADTGIESHLEHIVVGTPDPKRLAFPSPQCKQDPSLAASMPQAGGGHRRIRFDEGACKSIVPLPVSMQIPSDYGIRNADAHGCFWGADDDLKRVLADPSGVDFTSIKRGVFWCRVSENTEYDPVNKRFVSEMGDDTQWGRAFERSGVKNVSMKRGKVGVFPTLAMTVTMNGQKAYMLYLALPDTESLAVLINYHPAGRGGAADDAAWSDFVSSLQTTR